MSIPEGWGHGFFGSIPWGAGSGIVPPTLPGPPIITPLSPVDGESDVGQSAPLFIRLTDDISVNLATLSISVGPTVYVLGGVALNGAILSTIANGGNGFDLELVLPDKFPLDSRQTVVVSVRDHATLLAELAYYFDVGVGLRMIEVRNPSPRVLLVYFNRPLLRDTSLRFAPNWKVDPVSVGAAPLTITNVLSNENNSDMVTLRYRGGGSTYLLTNSLVMDRSGNLIDPDYDSALFELIYADEQAAADSASVRLFDTIYGPIGISKFLRLRRTMDDHVISRSIALGMNEQFRLRMKNLDGSAGRDGRPGKNRT